MKLIFLSIILVIIIALSTSLAEKEIKLFSKEDGQKFVSEGNLSFKVNVKFNKSLNPFYLDLLLFVKKIEKNIYILKDQIKNMDSYNIFDGNRIQNFLEEIETIETMLKFAGKWADVRQERMIDLKAKQKMELISSDLFIAEFNFDIFSWHFAVELKKIREEILNNNFNPKKIGNSVKTIQNLDNTTVLHKIKTVIKNIKLLFKTPCSRISNIFSKQETKIIVSRM